MRRAPCLRSLSPRLLTALGAALLLAGSVEIHPEAAHAWVPGDGELVYTCADRSGGAVHVEAARAEVREHCPGCLQRLQNGAACAPAPATFADRVASRSLPAADDPALRPAHHRRPLARGPPSRLS